MTIEELQKQIEEVKKQQEETNKKHAEEVANLTKQLNDEKLKNSQYVLAGMTRKVETHKEEPVEFDFE